MGRFDSLELDNTPEVQPQALHLHGEKIRNAEYYLKEALSFYRDLELELALRSYSKALEVDPGSVEAWTGQISCLIQLDELHEADIWSKKAAEIVGEAQDQLALRARICCRRGDFDRAYGLSDASMQSPGNSPLIWIVRGEIMLYSKNKQPEYCFDKALTASGQDLYVNMNIAECCIYAGKYGLALRYLLPAVNQNPTSASLLLMTAKCFHYMGNRSKAKEFLDSAEEIAPNCPGAENLRFVLKSESKIRSLFRRIFG